MTREEALSKVKGYLTDIITAEDYSEVEEIIEALEQEPKWIPVSEGLPKEGGDYLTTTFFDIGTEKPVREVYKDYFCVLSQKWLYRDEEIIAWMPLPKSYEPQKSEE